MAILPVGYSVPSSASVDYLNLKKTTTHIRIITPILPINRWWGHNYIYYSNTQTCPVDSSLLKPDQNGKPSQIQHIWAFGCWDVDDSSFKMAEIYQRSVINGIMALIGDKSWGDPTLYDLTINKPTSSKKYAPYGVTGSPKGYGSPLDKGILESFVGIDDPIAWLVDTLSGAKDTNLVDAVKSYFEGKELAIDFTKNNKATEETTTTDQSPGEKFVQDFHTGDRAKFLEGDGDNVVSEAQRKAFVYYATKTAGASAETMKHMVQNLGKQSSVECTIDEVNKICELLRSSKSMDNF